MSLLVGLGVVLGLCVLGYLALHLVVPLIHLVVHLVGFIIVLLVGVILVLGVLVALGYL